MRVDLRPAVVSRTMTKELMLAFFSLAAVICKFLSSWRNWNVGMPVYFLKVKPILDDYGESK